MRIGIFGGTFDPPHLGHLILASEAVDQLKLDRLLWVLTANPPHKLKQPISAMNVRLQMVQAAIADSEKFELSRVEIDRPGPHYAVDSICLLQEQFPQDGLFYLMGGDSLRDLPTWYKPQELVERVTGLGVMRRPGASIDTTELETALPGVTAKVQFFETPRLDISSSDIRQRIATGRPYRYFLLPAVYRLLQKHHLYRDGA
jgi:nicotinate-nucleotide adenylyltransferase